MAEYFAEQIEAAEQRTPTMEHMIGKGLLMPFNNVNSGARKIMHGVHRDHVFPLINGEKAIIETGYEIRFGDLSSSVTAADANYFVIGKISKFSFSPNHAYWLIMENKDEKKLDVIERRAYEFITEEYGFLYNNQFMDSLGVGSYVQNGTIMQKSLAFDEYMNRKDGVNLNTVYMSLDKNMEDSIIISQSAANKLVSPLIKPVQIMVNENNIPVNLYGDDNVYKCIPDIGEEIKNSILIDLRKEKKEEMTYTESVERLRKPMMSDDKKLLTGTVIDIDIYCNNPENLNDHHNAQFKMYYNELQRMAGEFVALITPYVSKGYTISHELEILYANAKRTLNHDSYKDKRPFSNIILNIVVLEHKPLMEGDKLSNRYGGKGVVSKIIPDDKMPKFGKDKEIVELIFNSYTMYGRQNPGQTFEVAINHVSHTVLKYIKENNLTINQAFDMILKFVDLVVPEQAADMRNTISFMNDDQRAFFLESMMMDGEIHISTKPISDSFDIDRLRELYHAFPFVKHEEILVPRKDSNGNIIFSNARRKVIVGKEYIFRLKQFAEEKFSATSLSSTNLAGFNSKSKANKNFLELHPNTPVRFGNMEINNENHLGPEVVIENLMIHSVSPHARKTVKQFYTCDPYEINIRLDNEATNRGAEIVTTRSKVIGRALRFVKVPKRWVKFAISPIRFKKAPVTTPIRFIKDDPNLDINKFYKDMEEFRKKVENDKNVINPISFAGIDTRVAQEQARNNKLAAEEAKLTMRERAERILREEKRKEREKGSI